MSRRGHSRLRLFFLHATVEKRNRLWTRGVPMSEPSSPGGRVILMDCRAFRNKHVAFVDDLLSAVEMDAMVRHRSACHRCSRHDTAVRRSLLIVRNLAPIEPSPD